MHDFNTLLAELSMARARHEDLRSSGAPFTTRMAARNTLHDLRVLVAEARRAHIEGI